MMVVGFLVALFGFIAAVIVGSCKEDDDAARKIRISNNLKKIKKMNADYWLPVGKDNLNEYVAICERAYSVFSGISDVYNYKKNRKLLHNIYDSFNVFMELSQQLSIGLEPQMASIVYDKMVALIENVEKAYLQELDKLQKTEVECALKSEHQENFKPEDKELETKTISSNSKRIYEIESLLDKLDFFCLNLTDLKFKEDMREICKCTNMIYETGNESNRLYGRFAQYYLPEVVKLCQTYNDLKFGKETEDEQLEELKSAILYMQEPFANILKAVKEDGNIDIKLNIETLKQVTKMDGIASDFS